GVIVAVVVIVAIFVGSLLLGAFNPPVDVYARPTPSTTESPSDLFPNQVAGYDLLSSNSDASTAIGDYGGGIQIQIARFASSGAASSELDAGISFWEDRSGSMTSVNAGEQHWFTFTGDGTSVFAWRKGVWVFVVFAPDAALRNQVAGELAF
ncbi:MAG: hypothetical protein LN413_06430, partial [Candidatus Thermoplasmatota archaeon]|nr:hypothetical protein [Candidatus Thermoplasmatota archaeon]